MGIFRAFMGTLALLANNSSKLTVGLMQSLAMDYH